MGIVAGHDYHGCQKSYLNWQNVLIITSVKDSKWININHNIKENKLLLRSTRGTVTMKWMGEP